MKKKIYLGKIKIKEVNSYIDTLRIVFEKNAILIDASCFWRILQDKKIQFTSVDYFIEGNDSIRFKGIFEDIIKNLKEKNLLEIHLSSNNSDLSMIFENRIEFQFFTSSIKYESWNMHINKKQYICLGNGEIAIFRN